MKLISKKLGQLIGLCCMEIVATSPDGVAATRLPVPDCVGPNGKTFPPNDNASWSSLVVPMLGCAVPSSTAFVSDGLYRARARFNQLEPIDQHRKIASAPKP